MTKKQLKIELEKAHNEIESLKSTVDCLEKQRTQLVEEKKKAMDYKSFINGARNFIGACLGE